MRISITILALALLALSHASRLYVSSYSGNITTVELTETADAVNLKATFQSQGCTPSPSWLEYHGKTSTLFCADEGFIDPTKATFTALKVETDGSLKSLDTVETLNGGVSTTAYKAGTESLVAIAHYGGSGISIVNTTDPSALVVLKTYKFTFGANGPASSDPAKPTVPFVHQVLLDPTGKFMLAPDLTADMVHIFGLSGDGFLTDIPGQEPLRVHQDSGPRHIAFYRPEGTEGKKTFVYLVMEKKNMLHGYEVVYTEKGTMDLKNVYMSTIFDGEELPAGAAAAEIKLTPDSKFLIISSRLDKLNPPGPSNPTSPSDTLVTFSLDQNTGVPKLLQKYSAGGVGPRSFDINRAGDRVAVALNAQNKLVIFKRDVKTGLFTGQLGSLDMDIWGAVGLVSSVVWAEDGVDDIVAGGGSEGGTSAVSGTTSPSSTEESASPSSVPSISSSEEYPPKSDAAEATQSGPGCPANFSLDPALPPPSAIPTSARSTAAMGTVQTSQLTNSLPELVGPTATRFPTTTADQNPVSSIAGTDPVASPTITSNADSFATVAPGSSPNAVTDLKSSANTFITTKVSQTTAAMSGTPTPVRADMAKKCQNFYEVKSGDTCYDICTKTGVPSKSFGEWNPGVGAECKGLVIGEWLCIGL